MRGNVHLMQMFAVVLLLTLSWNIANAAKCDRAPVGHGAPKSPQDGRFKIKVTGNPEKYVPGEVYTVSLIGTRTMQMPHKFAGFMLVVESDYQDSSIQNSHGDVGSFSLYGDALAKYSEKCRSAITHTSNMPKSEVQVMWTAPPEGSGCVTFRATVIEHRDIWYMDDGPLSKTLCEDAHESLDMQPAVVDPCCACDEAKYEVTFEGIWSRHTHPKDFPAEPFSTRFSDVIGASHTVNYRFWDYGQQASEGLRQVAEHGATRMLESELKAESEHIRTIIKARGISYPNITGKTFAVFRVDSRHHLVSLVSMIDPSPDWIVGVSGLELCLRNCSWVESKVLNLYPWDAGTDSGPTYTSPDQPTSPKDVIRRIRNNFPNDPRSPFYDASGSEMKPLAKLYLSRQRLYEKTCDTNNEESGEEDQGPCAVGEWQEWTSCSVTCGKGITWRQRFYRDQLQSEIMSCRRKLTERNSCIERSCSEHDTPMYSEEVINDPECALHEWSNWSGCSVQCGMGVRTRSRRYKLKKALKYCRKRHSHQPMLQQTDECQGEGEDCPEEDEDQDAVPPGCRMTEWSTWSPCSATCGKGLKMRNRYPEVGSESLRSFYKRGANRYNQPASEEEDGSEEDDEEEEDPDLDLSECGKASRVQEVECDGVMETCDMSFDAARAEVCSLPKDVGPCRSPGEERWFYDYERESCEPFLYSGCPGNKNNFLTEADCQQMCSGFNAAHRYGNLNSESHRYDQRKYNIYGGPVRPGGLTGDGSLTGTDGTPMERALSDSQPQATQHVVGNVQDCVLTRWSKWSVCNVPCGKGIQQKARYIVKHPLNGGKACPSPLMKTRPCKKKSCHNMNSSSSKENQQMNPTWGPANMPDNSAIDCLLSNWSLWSPCTDTCGPASVMQRTRTPLQLPTNGGEPCGNRVEVVPCKKFPCPI